MPPSSTPLRPSWPALLIGWSWPELRHHRGRHATVVLSVLLGVALAFAVHLINQSALGEFSAAVRGINGQPDLELRGAQGRLDEAWYPRVASHPGVAVASPVIDLQTWARHADGRRANLRLMGLDPLVAAPVSPALMPSRAEGQDRLALLSHDGLFLNAAARTALGVQPGDIVEVQSGLQWLPLRVAGSVSAGGAPLGVVDIAAAQMHFGHLGQLSRLDLRLQPGVDRRVLLQELALPAEVQALTPEGTAQRLSNVSRAYRVNLTVLALVALFTGAFLVFSVLSLSVAKRAPQLALLGVLGLGAGERMRLVLAEAAVLGVAGSALGLLAGTGLAALALRWLAGDLGGGFFPGVTPSLQWSTAAAATYGVLGVLAAVLGGWLPARAAQALAPVQALKGLGAGLGRRQPVWVGPVLLAHGAGISLLPPVAGLPVFAYLGVAALLVGGIACVPALVGGLLGLVAAFPPRHPGGLLALERARRLRHTATIAVAGVVAALSLAVALTVMVASFRASVSTWLDTVLPADLYARTATSGAAADTAFLPADFVQGVASLPGVRRVEALRLRSLSLDPTLPAVALIARPLADPARSLPLTGELQPARSGEVGSYVSEALAELHGARPGSLLVLPLVEGQPPLVTRVRGVWRDYARQHGAVVVARDDYEAATGDTRVNDLALWLDDGTPTAAVQAGIRARASDPTLIEFAEPREIRALSLRIFDRSFAVTYWLQAVAIAIGLFGVAASFSAQVLARRKEFGLLQHLGFTRGQVLAIVAGEGIAWTGAGAALGLALGGAVSVVLVHVVNPQSFHWTMDLLWPWGRLLTLALAVVAAGTLTAWLAGRAAAGRDAVLAVKEDW